MNVGKTAVSIPFGKGAYASGHSVGLWQKHSTEANYHLSQHYSNMIPKIIHYSWFSGEEMPQIVKDCIASWKQFMPNYEYRLWDMNAIKDIDSVFLKEALTAKKWAYAADYVRLYALYHEGGIYLDTDVTVFRSFDSLLHNKVFIGKEDAIHKLLNEDTWAHLLSSHCMGALPRSEYIKECLSYFEGRHFIQSTNEQLPQTLRYNLVMLSYIQAVIARKYGYDWGPKSQTVQCCKNGLIVYPSAYFCGHKHNASSYCKHLTLGSWRKGDIISAETKSPSSIKQRLRAYLDSFLLKYSYVLIKVK